MERSLIERSRRGDRDAFDLLVRRKVDAVYRTAVSILGHDADAQDATQEAFVAAWRRLPALRDPDRFDAWLGRILVNECRMMLRRRRRVREIRPAFLRAGADGSEATDEARVDERRDGAPPLADAQADADAFARAFERLTIDQRALLVSHYLEDRSLAEIAERLGIPTGTVKSRLHAARRALAIALEREAR